MLFEYVWKMLSVQGDPPVGKNFSIMDGEYRFYPYAHRGNVYTFDTTVWSHIVSEGKKMDNPHVITNPEKEQIADTLLQDDKCDSIRIFALSNERLMPAIGETYKVKINRIPQQQLEIFLKKFVDLGYDIIDLFGISGIANIGYKDEVLHFFEGTKINEFGLISNSEDAIRIANLVSNLVPEHAPFFPVNLWGCRRIKEIPASMGSE